MGSDLNDLDDFYSVAEAAAATGTCRTTILEAIRYWGLPALKNRRGWRIVSHELHRFWPPVIQQFSAGELARRLDCTREAASSLLKLTRWIPDDTSPGRPTPPRGVLRLLH